MEEGSTRSLGTEFRKWPGWLRATAAAIAAVVFAVILAVVLPVGARPREVRTQSDMQDAHRLCTDYARDRDLEIGAGFGWSAMTAGQLKVLARQFDIDVAPWDTYPNEHFIAQCSFSPALDLSTFSPTTPTTRCPDGSLVVLQPPGAITKVLVDESGTTSADPLEQLPGLPDVTNLCAGFGRN